MYSFISPTCSSVAAAVLDLAQARCNTWTLLPSPGVVPVGAGVLRQGAAQAPQLVQVLPQLLGMSTEKIIFISEKYLHLASSG